MKATSKKFIIIFGMLVSIVGCAGKTNPPSLLSLSMNDAETKTALSEQAFVYRHILRNSEGAQSIEHQIIPSNALLNPSPHIEAPENLFGILGVIQDHSRVRDVKKIAEGTSSMVVLRGLQLTIEGQSVTMDALATLKTSNTKPQRFTFSAQTEENPVVRKFVVVYQWGSHPFSDSSIWVPVEIQAEYIILRKGVEKQFSERWILETILPKAQNTGLQKNS